MMPFAHIPDPLIVHFSRDLADLVIYTIKEDGTVSIRIFIDTDEKAAFSLTSSGYHCAVRIRDVLERILPNDGNLHAVSLLAEGELQAESSSITDGSDGSDGSGENDTSIAFTVIRGGADGIPTSRSSDFILSLRPQIWKCYPSFPNPVIAVIFGGNEDCIDPVKLIVYPVGHPAAEYDLSYCRQLCQTLSSVPRYLR